MSSTSNDTAAPQSITPRRRSHSPTPQEETSRKRSRIGLRDTDYYFSDGSCVLLVDGVLFNVHRTTLGRDSSTFSTLFTLPRIPGQKVADGDSDESPIHLTGDTAEDFRHFLWALYALPHDLMNMAGLSGSNADVDRLLAVARVANKYGFRSVETWSLECLCQYTNRKPSPLGALFSSIPRAAISPSTFSGDTGSPPPPSAHQRALNQITSLIRLAQLCSHEQLMNTMIALLRQLMNVNVQYAYLAMTLADDLGLRSLLGHAYFEVMQKAVIVSPSASDGILGGDDADEQRQLNVTPSQQLRLLAGHYRLSFAWTKIRTEPPLFNHAVSCGAASTWAQQGGCANSWNEFWKERCKSEAVTNLGLADVLGRLRAISKDYNRYGSAQFVHHECRPLAAKALAELIRKVDEALPDYFQE